MEKIFTLLVTKGEIKTVKKVLNNYHIEEDNMDVSKVFNVQGYELVYFVIVTDEEIFTEITKSVNGQKIY